VARVSCQVKTAPETTSLRSVFTSMPSQPAKAATNRVKAS
jgi:hypothetical protein